MRHWLLAVALLLGASITSAQADYFQIVVHLSPSKGSGNNPTPAPGRGGMMGFPGGQPGGGIPGMPGAMRGGPGMPGMPGVPGGGLRGGAGVAGTQPPGGGFRGGAPNVPGQFGGMPGMPAGGMQGMQMRGGPGMMGAGMMGMMGMRGGPQFGQRPGTQLTDTKEDEEDDDDPAAIRATVVIEVRRYQPVLGKAFKVYHKWGTSYCADSPDFTVKHVSKLRPVAERFRKDFNAKENKAPEDWFDLASEALRDGLLKQFVECMDGLTKADPNLPAVKAYQTVRAQMKAPANGPDMADFWKAKLGNYTILPGEHYSLVYAADEIQRPQAEKWLDRLERNYRAFYYWFALHGKALPVPKSKLVAVLVRKSDEFDSLHKSFGSMPLEADGFFARRDNLAVFSSVRRDAVYTALNGEAKALWHDGWSRDKLLHSKGRKKGADDNTFIDAQMKALVLTAMEEQAEIEAVTAEGTRQLAAATGLLPRDVKVPKWFQFGLGSFFETPKSAFWEGTGAANWKYRPLFQKWHQEESLDKPEQALMSVVTDAYFANPKDRKAMLKAHTMSWALTYYLMNKRLDGVYRFCQELNRLPRDMELNKDILMGCFARAFDLAEAGHPDLPNASRQRELSSEWYSLTNSLPSPVPITERGEPAPRKKKTRRSES